MSVLNGSQSFGKHCVNELAIATGCPLFSEPLHVGGPNIGSQAAFLDRMAGILERRWLTNDGPMVKEFESRLQRFLDVRHVICISNATVGLELVIRALGLSGEVIVPSFTFVATAHALQWQEITPVFCDVGPSSHNMDPEKVEALITPRTTGIIGVHVWGLPCDHAELQLIAQRHGLKLMYDAAHAFACSLGTRMIGGFGDAEVFSFHATKFVNSFEGGAIATNDGELAQRIRLMRNFGFVGYDSVQYVGTNGKMTEAAAAMGLTNLDSLDEFVGVNIRNYNLYRELLADLPGIKFVSPPENGKFNYQYVVFELDASIAGLDRDALLATLHAERILARKYFYPGCHRMQPYRSLYPYSSLRLPRTEALVDRVVVLPTGTAVAESHIHGVASIVRLALSDPQRCRDFLAHFKATNSHMGPGSR